MYYIEKTNARHYVVRFSRFSCNSEIVADFTSRCAAMAYVARRNKESTHA